jgi:hypothetical protein
MRTCRSCFRSDLDNDARYCSQCGAPTTRRDLRLAGRVVVAGGTVIGAIGCLAAIVQAIGWVILGVFVIAIAGCVFFGFPG